MSNYLLTKNLIYRCLDVEIGYPIIGVLSFESEISFPVDFKMKTKIKLFSRDTGLVFIEKDFTII